SSTTTTTRTSNTSSKPTTTTTPTGTSTPPVATEVDQVVTLVNEARAEQGCAALTVDPHLTAAASAHSSDMSARGYFSHTTPENVTFDQRITAAGYPTPGAENIARGQQSA